MSRSSVLASSGIDLIYIPFASLYIQNLRPQNDPNPCISSLPQWKSNMRVINPELSFGHSSSIHFFPFQSDIWMFVISLRRPSRNPQISQWLPDHLRCWAASLQPTVFDTGRDLWVFLTQQVFNFELRAQELHASVVSVMYLLYGTAVYSPLRMRLQTDAHLHCVWWMTRCSIGSRG